MKMAQKTMREREPELTKHRYQTEASNYDSTPTLNRLRDPPNPNKENHNHHNIHPAHPTHTKTHHFDHHPPEIPTRLRTSANDTDSLHFRPKKQNQTSEQIHSSQQFFRFRTKAGSLRPEKGFISQQLTFGEVNQKRGLLTSRDFMEEKKMKNEVIDEMMLNAKRGLCKSFNDCYTGGWYCVNHPDKKAKYRLVSQLSEGEEEMFYCSKCAINLLQQNFKIEEVRLQDPTLNTSRLQLIARLELKLKTLENEAQLQLEAAQDQHHLDIIKEEIISVNGKFQAIIALLQHMHSQELDYLHALYLKKEAEHKTRTDNVGELMCELTSIQKEIVEYKQLNKFATMKENEFQFITTSLSNKITKFADSIPQLLKTTPSPKLTLSSLDERQILQKLEQEVAQKIEKQYTRRQREVTFSRKSAIKEFQKSEDQFICDQLKRPFRVLFPSDEMEMGQSTERLSDRNTMLQSVKERPTFTQIE